MTSTSTRSLLGDMGELGGRADHRQTGVAQEALAGIVVQEGDRLPGGGGVPAHRVREIASHLASTDDQHPLGLLGDDPAGAGRADVTQREGAEPVAHGECHDQDQRRGDDRRRRRKHSLRGEDVDESDQDGDRHDHGRQGTDLVEAAHQVASLVQVQ
ncbi:hypothetical protein [Brachybacterium sp. GPGPB12]|uniref:hypothetical protein n=1 Tax=Brachybacterium sp. GPGPB12 TaxID=3023517 RepID=UPI00313438BA